MAIAHEAVNQEMEWKRARVSQKRQVTIPQKFFEQAGIKDEIEFGIKGDIIMMRPVKDHMVNGHFSEMILADLIAEGTPVESLLVKFRERQAEMGLAVKGLITEALEAAGNSKGPGDDQFREIFGDVMGD